MGAAEGGAGGALLKCVHAVGCASGAANQDGGVLVGELFLELLDEVRVLGLDADLCIHS